MLCCTKLHDVTIVSTITIMINTLIVSIISSIIIVTAITANLPTNIMDFGGYDSSIILIARGGTPRSTGGVPEIWTCK